jgi:hypothetical protein
MPENAEFRSPGALHRRGGKCKAVREAAGGCRAFVLKVCREREVWQEVKTTEKIIDKAFGGAAVLLYRPIQYGFEIV